MADLGGRNFGFRFLDADLQWGDPVGQVISNFLTADGLMLQVVSESPQLVLQLLPSQDGKPQDCAAPFQFAPIDFAENPRFQSGMSSGALAVQGGELEVYELQVEGEFWPDGLGVENLKITGLVDTHTLDQRGVHICKAANCVACPGSNAETCVSLDLEVPLADWWPNAEESGDSTQGYCP
jgi:hypothetical protein